MEANTFGYSVGYSGSVTKRRTPGDGSLYKRSDGLWVGAIDVTTADGKRRRKTVSSKNRNTVLVKLRELRAQIDAGQVATTPSTTLSRWLDNWLENVIGPHIRPMTYKSYEQVIRLHIKPHIGAKRLNRLTAEDIRGMERAVQARSHRFAQLAHAVLGGALKQAVIEGHLTRSPVDAVKPPEYIAKKRAAFTAEIATGLIKTAFARGQIEGTMWAMAFSTGTRRSELIGIEWDRVDLVEGYVDMGWQLQRMKKGWTPPAGFEARPCAGTLWFTKPKSKAGSRVVPLLPVMVEALRQLKELDADNPNPHGLLFHHAADGRPITPEEFHSRWKALLADAGVPDVPAHTIRHTCATLLQNSGVDDQTRELILGHSSAAATRAYVHIDKSRQRAAVAGGLAELMPAAAPDTPEVPTNLRQT
jgi:integrase